MSIQVRPKNAASHICDLWVDLNKTKTGTNYFFLLLIQKIEIHA
jgi:hypothetical protein